MLGFVSAFLVLYAEPMRSYVTLVRARARARARVRVKVKVRVRVRAGLALA